jgi:F-type H+-transporting ATPase subunit c
MGAGMGIGRIGAAAAEGIARQPEAQGDIRGSSIILSAFIEGVALLGLVICLLVVL